MLVKLLTQWRDNRKGAVINVNENRAGLLIRSGIAAGIEDRPDKKKPQAETATAGPNVDAEAKAKAKAEADAARAAEKKAKAEAKAKTAKNK